jgi:hypothetical protein
VRAACVFNAEITEFTEKRRCGAGRLECCRSFPIGEE